MRSVAEKEPLPDYDPKEASHKPKLREKTIWPLIYPLIACNLFLQYLQEKPNPPSVTQTIIEAPILDS